MSTRAALKRFKPRVVKRSLAALLKQGEIRGLKAQAVAIKDAALAEKRELHASEQGQVAAIQARVVAMESELASARTVFERSEDDSVVYIRALSGAGRQKYLSLCKQHADEGSDAVPAAKIVALGLCEEDGELCFDVGSADDINELSGYDAKALDAIGIELFRISGLSRESFEEAEKKS